MTLDQVIAIAASAGSCVAALGSCIAAYATLRTVREMSSQRKASYVPELAFSRVSFEAVSETMLPSKPPAVWTAVGEKHSDNTIGFGLPLANVGLGTAKAVTVTWLLQIDKYLEYISKMSEGIAGHEPTTFENGILNVDGGRMVSNWEAQKESQFDYVLPAHAQAKPVVVPVPPLFIVLASAAVYFGQMKAAQMGVTPISPTLQIVANMKFRDIADEEHLAAWVIKLELHFVRGNGEEFGGHLEPCKLAGGRLRR